MIRVQEFFDKATFTLTYIVWDEATRDAVVIDPVLDYDPAASTASEESVAKVVHFLAAEKLHLHYVLETHAHADHLTGAQLLKARFPHVQVAISAQIAEVQKIFKPFFSFPDSFPTDGSQFDRLLKDREQFKAGSLSFEVHHTPGHTPACASYLIGDRIFTGDALFMPDVGVGRCDFPSGSAPMLYQSVKNRLYTLPDATKVFTGHDYLPGGRELRFASTIGEEKQLNIHLRTETSEEDFIRFRNERDKTLSPPRLLLPSVQINMNAGQLPAPHTNGQRYLTIPITERYSSDSSQPALRSSNHRI